MKRSKNDKARQFRYTYDRAKLYIFHQPTKATSCFNLPSGKVGGFFKELGIPSREFCLNLRGKQTRAGSE